MKGTRMIRKFLAALAVATLIVGLGATADADTVTADTAVEVEAEVKAPTAVPAAAYLCQYIANNNTPAGNTGANQVLFAEYEVLTVAYVQARCLHVWQSANVTLVCGFYSRYYSNGAAAGPYSLTCS